ncbi:MAG: T9SS type A sorting domain-containing protein [Flavobacteriales bacterium]
MKARGAVGSNKDLNTFTNNADSHVMTKKSGQLVLNLSNLPFEIPANIDVSMLNNGIYFIQIKTLKNQYHEKFIKVN